MLSKIYSAGISGIDGFEVTVECSSWNRYPEFDLVGLPDAAVKEAKNRVKSACENSGFKFPNAEIMVNLAPADTKKEGSAYDIAILLSILACSSALPRDCELSDKSFIGELSLSGEIRRIRGVLPMVLAARDAGRREIFVPYDNSSEAAVVDGITVYGAHTISEIVDHLKGNRPLKPVIYAANLDEDAFSNGLENNAYYNQVLKFAESEGAQVLPICAKTEQEIAELADEDKAMFLEELGIEESGLDRLIKCSYSLLGLISFLTAGSDEVRAWTIKNGTKPPQAVGKIHSDFERGFIRAEIVAFDDLKACGSMVAAKEKGLVRSEGKDYVLQDGDVVQFRFNV